MNAPDTQPKTCPTETTFQITFPTGHVYVKGTCIHHGEGRSEVRNARGEVQAVAYSTGIIIHRIENGQEEKC